MSSGARSHTAPPPADRPPVSLPRLAEMKEKGEPIAMVTAYDFPSAKVAEEAGVDLVLVGDTAAMVVLGYSGTEPVSMEEMIVLGKAVRRGLKTALMIGDLPMGSYESSNELAVLSAQRLIKETGAQTVKLEAGGVSAQRAKAIVVAISAGTASKTIAKQPASCRAKASSYIRTAAFADLPWAL